MDPKSYCDSSNIMQVRDPHDGTWFLQDVSEPVTITTKDTSGSTTTFTSYLIRLETNHLAFPKQFSAVRRRYSEFCWLRAQLVALYQNTTVIIPELPPKRYLYIFKYHPKVLENRRLGLTTFIHRLLETPCLRLEPCVHYFLQTDLTIPEMERAMHAKKRTGSTDSSGSFASPHENDNALKSNGLVLARSISYSSGESEFGSSASEFGRTSMDSNPMNLENPFLPNHHIINNGEGVGSRTLTTYS